MYASVCVSIDASVEYAFNKVKTLDTMMGGFVILKFCSVFVFLGFLGKDLRMHDLAYTRRLDFVCADLF